MMYITFVCTGNICRSPMAELYSRSQMPASHFSFDSCGTRAISNKSIHPFSAEYLTELNVTSNYFRSRLLNRKIISATDLIVVMESVHLTQMSRMYPSAVSKAVTLGALSEVALNCPIKNMDELLSGLKKIRSNGPDIPDPVSFERAQYFDVIESLRKRLDLTLQLLDRLSIER